MVAGFKKWGCGNLRGFNLTAKETQRRKEQFAVAVLFARFKRAAGASLYKRRTSRAK